MAIRSVHFFRFCNLPQFSSLLVVTRLDQMLTNENKCWHCERTKVSKFGGIDMYGTFSNKAQIEKRTIKLYTNWPKFLELAYHRSTQHVSWPTSKILLVGHVVTKFCLWVNYSRVTWSREIGNGQENNCLVTITLQSFFFSLPCTFTRVAKAYFWVVTEFFSPCTWSWTISRTEKGKEKNNSWGQLRTTTNPVCVRRINFLVCSLSLHRHSHIGFHNFRFIDS
jgi:hypothetical protein